jgi:hypothetical protein
MYDADPFTARKEVDERQAKAAKKREETDGSSTSVSRGQPVSGEFSQAPEVKMASGLRDIVEDAIKKASDAGCIDNSPTSTNVRDRRRPAPYILKQWTWFIQFLGKMMPPSSSNN